MSSSTCSSLTRTTSILNPFTAEDDLMHVWAVRLDGLGFAAGYSESQ